VRVWTKSACVVLAWGSILVVIVAAAGMSRPAHPARANIRTASSSNSRSRSSSINVTGPGAVTVAAVFAAAPPAGGYVVQPGDTLSGIATALAVRGGWSALYAANRRVIGPDPNVIRPGAVLVLPSGRALARYTVAAGDTLSGIAAALAVRGGWPALYAANRRVIGPDPALIRVGTVLGIPHPAARAAGSGPGRAVPPGRSARPGGPGGPGGSHHRLPGTAAPAAAGVPRWLEIMLVAAGLVTGAAFVVEPVLLIRRRRRRRVGGASARPGPARTPALVPPQVPLPRPGPGGPAAAATQVVLADYDRVVVTYRRSDGTVYVLRPPGQDPAAILRVARLVLPEGPYRDLADRLGMPASWPIVVADYDRVVVTCSARDGTVCVLRPPGHDPAAVLKAARLVLPEDPYQELADQLGVPASLPAD
jgi:LysM repeat protein